MTCLLLSKSAFGAAKIKSYNCLICGQRAGKSVLRAAQEKGINSFINALSKRHECNGFSMSDFMEYVDFETGKWIRDIDNFRCHPRCYSNFTTPRNLTFLDVNQPSNGNSSSEVL